MKHILSAYSPLYLMPGDALKNYVETWRDDPKDVKAAADEDIENAAVDNGVMTLRLNALVSQNMVQYFHAIERNYAKIAGKCSEIRISLNTYGGAVTDGFEIIDMVREWNASRGVKISFIGSGAVYSMGVPIMQAASRRYSYPNAEYLIHPVSAVVYGTRQDIEDALASVKNSEAAIASLIAKRSGLSMEGVAALMQRDSYITAEEALGMGLIDEIVGRDAEEPPEGYNCKEKTADMEKRAREMRSLEIYLTEVM